MADVLAKRLAAATLAFSVAGAGALVAHEGWVKVGYKDPVGIPTACAGHTATAVVGKRYTEDECLELLRRDVKDAEAAVKRLVTVRLTQGQFDALVSFTFNVGSTNLARSGLLRKLNTGDCLGAAREFDKWVYAKGKKLPGLVSRRADERKLFERGCNVASYTGFGQAFAGHRSPPGDLPTGRHAFAAIVDRRVLVGSS